MQPIELKRCSIVSVQCRRSVDMSSKGEVMAASRTPPDLALHIRKCLQHLSAKFSSRDQAAIGRPELSRRTTHCTIIPSAKLPCKYVCTRLCDEHHVFFLRTPCAVLEFEKYIVISEKGSDNSRRRGRMGSVHLCRRRPPVGEYPSAGVGSLH